MAHVQTRNEVRFPLWVLLDPREQTPALLLALLLGLLLAGLGMWQFGVPLWQATLATVGLLLVPVLLKWRIDLQRLGPIATILGVLVAAQGFHTLEHIAQWIEFHLLNWTAAASTGLISVANAEWIHFAWNWVVLAVIVYLMKNGARNMGFWLLLTWATLHTLEHTYIIARYIMIARQLQELGFAPSNAFQLSQSLPGILGRDGWLARSPLTQGTYFCRIPGLTTAPRLDVHFWWNAGEFLLLLLGAHRYLKTYLSAPRSTNSTLNKVEEIHAKD